MSRPEEILRGLAESGPRVAGTATGARCGEWVSRYLRDMGFEIEPQEFDCSLWSTEDRPRLRVEDGPEFECTPMIGSVSGDAQGRLEHHGRMLIWGDKSWRSFRLVGDYGEILAHVLVRPEGPAAPQPLPREAADLPHVVVGARDGQALQVVASSGRTAHVQLQTSEAPVRGHNVRAWTGEDALSYGGAIFVTAHVDTVPGTPGAYDNAGGVAALVEVAACIAAGELPPRVQLLLTDAEELHLAGSRAFVGRLAADGRLGNVSGCLNLDGAGRGDVLDVWVGPASLADLMLPLVDRRRVRFIFPPPESGDHTAFRERCIPAMMLTFDDPEIIHRAEDIYEESKLNNALRMSRIATGILERLTHEGVW